MLKYFEPQHITHDDEEDTSNISTLYEWFTKEELDQLDTFYNEFIEARRKYLAYKDCLMARAQTKQLMADAEKGC